MSSLDDAIREHLELKRRLGASEDEIKEKEAEAFGKGSRPPRAETEEPAPAEPAPISEADFDEAFIDPGLPAAEPTANGQHSTVELDPTELSAAEGTATADEIFEPDEVPPAESLDPALTVRDERGTRNAKPEAPADAGDEDVLEETPEFLEETPEHDRLWFEQRPPKDFDFD